MRTDECFSNVDAFARALDDATWCGHVARTSIRAPVGHIGKGLEFYLSHEGTNISALASSAPIFLVRMEHMAADLDCFFRRCVGAQAAPTIPRIHTRYAKQNDTYLSAEARANLDLMLADEYYFARELERHAVPCGACQRSGDEGEACASAPAKTNSYMRWCAVPRAAPRAM